MNIDNDFVMQSEQHVIGSLLVDNNVFDELESLKADAFFAASHRVMYSTISEMIGGGKLVDLILLAEELERRGELEQAGGFAYIGSIVKNCGAIKNAKPHANKIINQWKLRRLKALLVDLDQEINDHQPIEQILSRAEKEMFSLLEGEEESRTVHIKQAVIEAVEWEDQEFTGVQTGLRDLDRLINGMGKSDLVIIAGRPSMGKTSLAMQIAEHVANTEAVAVFSLEMSRRQVGSRMLSFHENRVGKSQAIAHLSNMKLHIDDKPAATIQHIRSECRKIKRKAGLSMIVIDYLQLMTGSGDNRNQEIGAISRGLKGLAKEFDVPLIALSQLSRKVDDRADKKPLMSDLRDSGEIEQDADLILFIYRDEVYFPNSDFKGLAEIICRKNRNGATGEITTCFDGQHTRFKDFNGQPILRAVKTTSRGFD